MNKDIYKTLLAQERQKAACERCDQKWDGSNGKINMRRPGVNSSDAYGNDRDCVGWLD